jgi:hypothetical protein
VEKAIDKKKISSRGLLPFSSVLSVFSPCYANGIVMHKNHQDFDCTFRLFNLAAEHGHPDAACRNVLRELLGLS